jgi:hypothetical protein
MSDSLGSPFSDGKAPDALRTIGEVADALGIRQHVLRYWEEQFPMLKPLKRSGGRRYYRADDVAMVATIDRLVHREGYTLKGAKAVLSGKGSALAAPPLPVAAPQTPAQFSVSVSPGIPVGRLQEIRNQLAAALEG